MDKNKKINRYVQYLTLIICMNLTTYNEYTCPILTFCVPCLDLQYEDYCFGIVVLLFWGTKGTRYVANCSDISFISSFEIKKLLRNILVYVA